jgi:transcriptional regulator with XRE-family HTH domain
MSRKKSEYDKSELKKIGYRIKTLRKLFGLNQAEFGKSIGISGNYLSEIELGKVEPSKPILIAIEYRYSINQNDLISGEKDDIFQVISNDLKKKPTLPIKNLEEQNLKERLELIESRLDMLEKILTDSRPNPGRRFYDPLVAEKK